MSKDINWKRVSIYSWRANENDNMMLYYIWGNFYRRTHETKNEIDVSIRFMILCEVLNFIDMIYNIFNKVLYFNIFLDVKYNS